MKSLIKLFILILFILPKIVHSETWNFANEYSKWRYYYISIVLNDIKSDYPELSKFVDISSVVIVQDVRSAIWLDDSTTKIYITHGLLLSIERLSDAYYDLVDESNKSFNVMMIPILAKYIQYINDNIKLSTAITGEGRVKYYNEFITKDNPEWHSHLGELKRSEFFLSAFQATLKYIFLHEIYHIKLKHKKPSNISYELAQDQELEADYYAIESLMKKNPSEVFGVGIFAYSQFGKSVTKLNELVPLPYHPNMTCRLFINMLSILAVSNQLSKSDTSLMTWDESMKFFETINLNSKNELGTDFLSGMDKFANVCSEKQRQDLTRKLATLVFNKK